MLSPQDEEFLNTCHFDYCRGIVPAGSMAHDMGRLLSIVGELKKTIESNGLAFQEAMNVTLKRCEKLERDYAHQDKVHDAVVKSFWNDRENDKKERDGLRTQLEEEKVCYMHLRERLDTTIHILEKSSAEADKLELERDGLRDESQERFDALRFIMPFLEEDDGTFVVPDYQLAIDRVKKALGKM